MQADWFADGEHQPFHFDGEAGGALLLHGFMGTPKEMRPLARRLNLEGMTVSGPLLPGFGEQVPMLHSTTRRDWLECAARSWEREVVPHTPKVLVGFSMGGAIALHLAQHYPIDRLILIAPLWKVLGGDWKLRLLPVVKHVVRRVRPFAKADFSSAEVRQFFLEATPGLDIDDPAVQETIRREIQLPTATVDELRRLASEAGDIASKIDAPTLVIQGTEDASVSASHTRLLVSKMNSRVYYRELSGGHLLVADNHDSWHDVADLVSRFSNGESI